MVENVVISGINRLTLRNQFATYQISGSTLVRSTLGRSNLWARTSRNTVDSELRKILDRA